jgi:aminoglycoside phosphotransferase (APT) family kinase protein
MANTAPLPTTTDAALSAFALPGPVDHAARYGNGHINDTILAVCGSQRFIAQRLNDRVFPDGDLVMGNIAAVCGHLASVEPDAGRRLQMVPTRDGAHWHIDAEQRRWRVYPFVEGTSTVEQVTRPEQAHAAALSFARFQRQLASYAGPRLGETIRDFHHTPRRLERLHTAAAVDAHGRLAEVQDLVQWALSQADFAGVLVAAQAAGTVPERLTHNDTKINNVLFDAAGRHGRCVIDLDTIMPGLSLYDFGDLVRTSVCRQPEDHDRPDEMVPEASHLDALVTGWLEGCGAVLTAMERQLMLTAAAVMTYEVGVRFLTDHLDGDRYFRIRQPGHNRQRAAAQLALARNLQAVAASGGASTTSTRACANTTA